MIGLIAVLIAILMPALVGARDHARRIQCATNLKNIAAALEIYANESRGRLPACSTPTQVNWSWVIPTAIRDALLKAGVVRQNFYCPSRDQSDEDEMWELFLMKGFTATGYYWLIGRPGIPAFSTPGPFATNLPIFMGYPEQYDDAFRRVRWRIDLARSSELELVTDQTVSFDGVFRAGTHGIGHGTNHVRRGGPPQGGQVHYLDGHNAWRPFSDQPLGGQILYLDGHVAWRPFREMKVRYVPGDDEWF